MSNFLCKLYFLEIIYLMDVNINLNKDKTTAALKIIFDIYFILQEMFHKTYYEKIYQPFYDA